MGGESCALLVNNVPANMKDDCIAALFNIYGDIVGIHLGLSVENRAFL